MPRSDSAESAGESEYRGANLEDRTQFQELRAVTSKSVLKEMNDRARPGSRFDADDAEQVGGFRTGGHVPVAAPACRVMRHKICALLE
jgi:hypothetical protein